MVENDEELEKALQRGAREEMKLKLLQDITVDINVCELMGTNPKEYLLELKEMIDDILSKFGRKNDKI